MQKFTLFRFPMAHSFSPFIHQAFAEQFNLNLTYTVTEAKPHHLKEAIAHFRQQGGFGANITIPFKEEAYTLCEKVTARCKQAQSVNTLYWQDNTLWGDNTDGVGFIRDITNNLQYSFKDQTICIFGAGGAAAGIISEIAAQLPKAILICNRSPQRAHALKQRFLDLPVALTVLTYAELNSRSTSPDWIINTTPFSLTELLLPIQTHLVQNTLIYELAYAKEGKQSAFAKWALQHGAKAVFDGLGMLVEQAAECFSVWQHGLFPATQPLIAQLRQQFLNA